MIYLLPLKGDVSLIKVGPKRIPMKANMRPGPTFPFTDKAKGTVAIPVIIIVLIISCSGIAGAGSGP